MVQGIAGRRKRYVEVAAVHTEDGQVRPTAITWGDGERFEVDHIHESRRATSLKVGGTGIRYLISVRGTKTYLFYEGPRWFVEEKLAEVP